MRLAGILVNGPAGRDGLVRTIKKRVLRKLFGRKPEPLTGTPAIRRMKTYSAQTGYVYQYFYEGHRGPEYVFSVSSDRKQWNHVSVMQNDAAIREWEHEHGRELSSTERYAIAKMALFAAFDERSTTALMKDAIQVGPAEVASITGTLEL